MIRPATSADTNLVIQLGIDAGMFAPDEVEPIYEILNGFHAGTSSPGHELYLRFDETTGDAVGVIFFGPDAMTDRKWDLWMIAVTPGRQGQGIGSELISYTEQQVQSRDGRLLIIDTSSQAKYDPTRAFYAKHGFVEVARIPDFYADGDSKITYWKRILSKT